MSDGEFGFKVMTACGASRRARLHTAHGSVETPAFMPVGTAGTVKAMTPQAVREAGAEIVLANTYHLMLRPGAERVGRLGGLHQFMNWPGPILTDSGGFQVMSLAERREIMERGVVFRSHLDGTRHELTPERAVEVQHLLGADITMVLDECTAWPVAESEAADSMRLSMRWASRSKDAFVPRSGYGLFGIVQGSAFLELRAESVSTLVTAGFDGYAIGGLAVGEGREAMLEVTAAVAAQLPVDKPRYLMGVGKPEDIVEAVSRGVDLFDCVLPTRSGRTGQAFTRRGTVNLRNARHAEDSRPLDDDCACPTCRHYSRAYLHHLVRAGEILCSMLLTWHNLHYYQELMADLRKAIEQQAIEDFAGRFLALQAEGDIAAV